MNKILLLISVAASIILILPAKIIEIIIGILMIPVITVISIKLFKDKDIIFPPLNRLSLIFSFLLGLGFYNRWIYSSMIKSFTNMIGLSNITFLLIASFALVISSLYFINSTMHLLSNFFASYHNLDCAEDKVTKNSNIFLFIVSIFTITLLSKSSFLYPLNDWVDANCFFTVGKSILSGKVPYLDLFEQKGPLLYFLHALAALISYDTFFGVYLIEIVACYLFLYNSYRILRLFVDKNVIYFMPLFSFVLYSLPCFCHGDSAEELCLPLLSYGLYVSVKCLKKQTLPSLQECLLIGVTSSCVLWIKFSLLGFYIGWIVFPSVILIKKKQIKELLKLIGTIALGVLIVSIPIFIYFIYNYAIMDLFEVYFYNNMFAYNKSESNFILFNIIHGLASGLIHNPLLFLMLTIGFFSLKKKEFLNVFIIFIATASFIFLNATSYLYYTFILCAFTVFSIVPIYILLHRVNKKFIVLLEIIGIIICVLNSSNTYMLFEKKENLPQFQFSEIISKEKNPTLLNYGFLDGGFYTTSNIVPDCKYFCRLNIQIDEMFEGQDQCLEEGTVDFVVTRNQQIDYPNYELVTTSSYYFEGTVFDYYLYHSKD